MQAFFKSSEFYTWSTILIKQWMASLIDGSLKYLHNSCGKSHHLSALGRDYLEVFDILKLSANYY
jgi:hypothetical protein